LNDQKKVAKEKSPAGEKLPEIHSQWRQELQQVLRFLFFRPPSLLAILAYRHCSEFFNGNFSHAGSFSKLNVSFELRLFFQLLGCPKNVLDGNNFNTIS